MKQIEEYQVILTCDTQYYRIREFISKKGLKLDKTKYQVCYNEKPNDTWIFFYEDAGEWNLRCKEHEYLKKVKYEEFIELFEEKRTEFYKGDYIVLLNKEYKEQYLPNYVYKIRQTDEGMCTELDCRGSITNGWDIIKYSEGEGKTWRWATQEEIDMYDKAGKPVSITTKMFTKGQYVVLLIEAPGGNYLKDHVYQIREDGDYFLSVLDNSGSKSNGWYKIRYNTQNEYWRYATLSEVEKYLKNQKPVSIVEKVPPRSLVFTYGDSSKDMHVDDIVVSLNYVPDARKNGDMFQVLKDSYLGKLSYSPIHSSNLKSEWRLATAQEKIDYEEGITNIYNMPPHPIPPTKNTQQTYMSEKIEVFDDVYVGDTIYAANDQKDYDLKKGEPCTVHTQSERNYLVIYKYGKRLGSHWGTMDWFSKTPLPETADFMTGSISVGGNISIIQGSGYTVEPSIHIGQPKKGFDEAEYQKHPFNQSLTIKTKKRKK